ncbi:hypothetical protein [Desulfuromonas sp. AOP6]|uniref:hypothetical protein n=1 Tax=Desulfuromonas sp. AOP6 TaxID=1566351 RepID=UPI0012833917|nr:hypothetical protein [Desulfuromonas sp. AOP6]BCA79288.1 hypothetical protein AOP6_1075 [Desulfuromonas sp. AOP6]
MDWSTIITIILGSSLLGAILTNISGWLVKRRERSNHATFVALNLAHLFEKYAYSCLSATEDHDTAESSGGYAGDYIQKILELPELPDYDYRVFDLPILDKVFDFPQQIGFAAKNLSFAFEVLDGEDAVREGYKSCLQLAREALVIADAIRGKYSLEKRQLKFGEYSVRERLREKLSKLKVD